MNMIVDLFAYKFGVSEEFECRNAVHQQSDFSFEFFFSRTQILRIGSIVAVIDSELFSVRYHFKVTVILLELL